MLSRPACLVFSCKRGNCTSNAARKNGTFGSSPGRSKAPCSVSPLEGAALNVEAASQIKAFRVKGARVEVESDRELANHIDKTPIEGQLGKEDGISLATDSFIFRKSLIFNDVIVSHPCFILA